MALIVVTTGTESAPSTSAAAVLVDALWAATLPGDAIEHISVRRHRRDIAVGVFVNTADGRRSRTVAQQLMNRACAMSPLLRDGKIHAAVEVSLPELIHPEPKFRLP